MQSMMARWDRRPAWFRAIEVPLGIVIAAILVATPFALFTGHSGPARNASAGPTTPSWELVPGNICWNDRAGVLRQLQSYHYKMDECVHNDGNLVTEWWIRDGWPTVVVRQHRVGAPITLDTLYMPYDVVSDESLIVSAGSRTEPVQAVTKAAKALFSDTSRLRTMPSKVDCTTDTYNVPVSGVADGQIVRFTFSFDVKDGGRTITPPSCPLG